MRFNPQPVAISASDEAIRAALAVVDVVPLIVAVAQITGDDTLLKPEFRPDLSRVLEPDAGMAPDQLAAMREIAADALIRFRDGGSVPAPAPDPAMLRALLEFLAGADLDEAYVPLLAEELALGGKDLRAPEWTAAEVDASRQFRVAIVGSGMSGLVAAHRLRQAGIDVVIFEKNADLGGTWYENTYPGCRVDIASHFYSYSFAQTNEWPQFYSTQRVLHDYFSAVASEFNLTELIRFRTEVVSASWDDTSAAWSVVTRDENGVDGTHRFDAVVSAVGQLNRPKMPDIDGIDGFAGDWFHSARWEHDVELAGKRVGIVGTGASAAQFIPIVAEEASHLTVFQRTPPWLLPVPHYQDDLPDGLRWVLRHLPEFARWDRLWVFWRTHESLLQMAVVDPEWPDQARSVSAANDLLRELFSMYYQVMFTDPELQSKVLPTYPPIAKRVVLDNGSLPMAYQRENVDLITDSVREVTERGVVTADGVEHEFDVIIYGTGFHASKFLTPMAVTGVDGADLHARWNGDARAYLGIVVPQFPNLFLMYGPNTNIVINGSIIYFSECEAHFITESVRMLLERGAAAMDCREEAHDRYNEWIDAGNRSMAWGASDVNSWYKNEHGRVAQNWPYSLLEYWQQTREPNPDDYVLR